MSKTGEVLTSLRQERGWRQCDLSHASGLSTQYINDIEHGRRNAPPAAVIERLSAALGADRVYLMTAKVYDTIGDDYEIAINPKKAE